MQRIVLQALAVMCVCALWLAGSGRAVQAEPLTVFAASSLRDAVEDLAARHEAATGDKVVTVFAASSAIARQVVQGAPADVVMLADKDWADWIVSEGAVDATEVFATNQLVLVSRQTAPLAFIEHLPAALEHTVLAMAQTEAVPAGRYGRAALGELGIWPDVEPKVVQAANVRAALRFVQRGEAGYGIGYASDVIALPDLSVVYRFPAGSHPPILFSGAPITPNGSTFWQKVISGAGPEVFAAWGFLPSQHPAPPSPESDQ